MTCRSTSSAELCPRPHIPASVSPTVACWFLCPRAQNGPVTSVAAPEMSFRHTVTGADLQVSLFCTRGPASRPWRAITESSSRHCGHHPLCHLWVLLPSPPPSRDPLCSWAAMPLLRKHVTACTVAAAATSLTTRCRPQARAPSRCHSPVKWAPVCLLFGG